MVWGTTLAQNCFQSLGHIDQRVEKEEAKLNIIVVVVVIVAITKRKTNETKGTK